MPRILLVDDDPAWRNLYRMALEGQFDLFEATDGYQALSVLGSVRPNVIVLDLRMPRMDGMDFLQRLNRRSPRPKVVVCSGTFTEADRPHIPDVYLAAKTPDLKGITRTPSGWPIPQQASSTFARAIGQRRAR